MPELARLRFLRGNLKAATADIQEAIEAYITALQEDHLVVPEDVAPDPVVALVFAREHGLEEGRTEDYMKEIRGDDD